MTIQTTKLYSCLYRKVLIQIITSYLCICLCIIDTNIRISYLTKILATFISFINSCSKDYLFNVLTNLCQVNIQGFIITTITISTSQIIACRFHRAIWSFLISIEYKEFLLWNLTILTQHECRSIQVEIITRTLIRIPTESYTY